MREVAAVNARALQTRPELPRQRANQAPLLEYAQTTANGPPPLSNRDYSMQPIAAKDLSAIHSALVISPQTNDNKTQQARVGC
jgi:hypothetical protein